MASVGLPNFPTLLIKYACQVAILPVSVPRSILMWTRNYLCSTKNCKYCFAITEGFEFEKQTRKNNTIGKTYLCTCILLVEKSSPGNHKVCHGRLMIRRNEGHRIRKLSSLSFAYCPPISLPSLHDLTAFVHCKLDVEVCKSYVHFSISDLMFYTQEVYLDRTTLYEQFPRNPLACSNSMMDSLFSCSRVSLFVSCFAGLIFVGLSQDAYRRVALVKGVEHILKIVSVNIRVARVRVPLVLSVGI